jgi:hypothetical protein
MGTQIARFLTSLGRSQLEDITYILKEIAYNLKTASIVDKVFLFKLVIS